MSIDSEGWGAEDFKAMGRPIQVGELARIPSIHPIIEDALNRPGSFLTDLPQFQEHMGVGCYSQDMVTGEIFPWPNPCEPSPIDFLARRREVLGRRGMSE